MTIEELLKKARKIWGDDKLTLEEIIIRQGVAIGDIHRYARDKEEGTPPNETELKKELGNVIFSTIRWCDDLGYSPEECIELAEQAQIQYRQRQAQS
ncbi:MAG TPA: hypothetical protein VHB72_02310 [Candidatus Saccharimonadales bacterium]|nr:hypothetical protein [Candidatus Saccharimonadales bacterium]